MKNKNIYWDLDEDLISSPLIREIIFNIKKSNRKAFCNWIKDISKKHSKDIDWWLTIPSSRNPYLSDLYSSICILETIDRLIKKKYFLKITTSSYALYEIIKKRSISRKNYLEINFIKKKSNLKYFYVPKAILFYFFIFFYIKIFIKKKILQPEIKKTLVESFSLYPSNNKENFNKNILKVNSKNLFLVPSFLIQKNIFLLIKTIGKTDMSKHVFKEHYLTLNDCVFSFLHFIRKKKFIAKFKKFKSWDLSPIVNKEIKSNKNFYSAIIGILNYRFFKRLQEKNIFLKKTISLFENQAVGRGWNLGSRTFFPNIENLGYQGYINFSQFLNSIPCQFEDEAKILPNKIAVINKIFKNNKKEFFSKIQVTSAPALNFKFDTKKIRKNYSDEFILILTGIKKIDQKLIEWSVKFLKNNRNIKLIIKFHPILPHKSFDILSIKNLKEQISFSNEDISSLLNRSLLVVSTGPTSAIYEALIKGCYLMIPVFDPWDQLNIENCKIPKENYDLVYNFQEFSFNLKNMIKNKKKIKLKNVKKKFFFEQINKKNMKIFH